MHYQPKDGKWQLGGNARLLFELRDQMTPEEYEQKKRVHIAQAFERRYNPSDGDV